MVESTRQVQTGNPFDRFDEAINDPSLYPAYQYDRPESRQLEPLPQDPVPLFLSDYDQRYEDERYEDDAREYTFAQQATEGLASSRIVTGVLGGHGGGRRGRTVLLDATRDGLVNAKASLASLAPASFRSAQPEAASPPAAPPPRVQRQSRPSRGSPRRKRRRPIAPGPRKQPPSPRPSRQHLSRRHLPQQHLSQQHPPVASRWMLLLRCRRVMKSRPPTKPQ